MKRVVVTRAAHQAGELADLLRERGFIPVLYPCITIRPPEDAEPLTAMLTNFRDYDWLMLTSANAVHALAEVARTADSPPDWGSVSIATVGEATAAAVRAELAADVAFVAPQSTAEALAESLPISAGARILLPQSEIASPDAQKRLRERGAVVTAITAYRTGCVSEGGEDVPGMLRVGGRIDALTFMSGSAARCFVARIAPESAYDLPAFCIGPSTLDAARVCGFRAVYMPAHDFSAGGLVARLVEYFEGENPHP